jgi:hypothetical protein
MLYSSQRGLPVKNETFIEENYAKETVTINIIWANIFALIILLISALVFGLPFYLLWHNKYVIVSDNYGGLMAGIISGIKAFLLFFSGIILHEMIHGIFFMIFAKKGIGAIKFGIMPANKLFSPYCNCKEPLKPNHYKIAAIMPTLILGIIPAILSLFTGSYILALYGIIYIGGGGGDILIVMKLIKEKKDSWILDHPSDIGYYAYRSIKPKV